MSIARSGTRAALVGLGVLASLAFTTAPSWAGGGNSANAKLCEEGYPGVLLNQQAETVTFKNAGQCTNAGAKGELAGVNAVAGPLGAGGFSATFSGFGLKSETVVLACDKLAPGVEVCRFPSPVVGADGTFSAVASFPACELVGSKLAVQATTAAGSVFTREFPPPSGC